MNVFLKFALLYIAIALPLAIFIGTCIRRMNGDTDVRR